MTDETRITNESTGGEKGRKLARYDLVPVGPLRDLAEHFGKNAVEHGGKYEARNWERGVDWSLNYAAALRHLTAWWGGEDLDEDGNSHLVAAMWHLTVLREFEATHPELDDRPNGPPRILPADWPALQGSVHPSTVATDPRQFSYTDQRSAFDDVPGQRVSGLPKDGIGVADTRSDSGL